MGNERQLSSQYLKEVYRSTVDPLYRFVSQRTGGDRELSEDLVQETYLRAVRSWSRNGVPENPMAWLQTVSRNLLIGYWRKNRPERMSELDEQALKKPPDAPEAAMVLQRAMGSLQNDQAALLESFHFEGKRVSEIAAELGVSERAVEGRLRRARQALRACLKRLDFRGEAKNGE